MTSTSTAPFASFNAHDHGAQLWVAALLCLAFTATTLLARIYVRWRIFGTDDYAIFIASAVGLSQFAVIFDGLSHGLGVSTSDLSTAQTAWMGRVFLASEALLVLTTFLAKTSVLLGIERVLGNGMQSSRLTCRIFHGVVILSAVASMLVITLRCSSSELLTQRKGNACASQTQRWTAVAVIDGVTELGMFLLIFQVLYRLQMRVQMKVATVVMFGIRLFCPVLAGAHVHFISDYVSISDAGVAVVGALVWQQICIAFALLSALILALKGFLGSFDMAMGLDPTYAIGSKGSRDAYGLEYLSRTSRGTRSANHKSHVLEETQYRPDGLTYDAKISHPSDGQDASIRSGISQHPIIKREVQYTVSYENREEDSQETLDGRSQ